MISLRKGGANTVLLKKLRTWLELVKFEHTIFALPFAYGGAFLAARGWPTWHQFLWITVAMVGARTAAMSVNRLVDRRLDAANPRTAGRHLPAGKTSPAEVAALVIVSVLLLGLSAWQLNPLCLALFPAAVLMLIIYSFTKRWTWLCHLVLGLTDAWAPFGGWIAVTGRFEWGAVFLALAVALWVGGFDILYALQDLDFDRTNRLFSIPARFGVRGALVQARTWHGAVVLLLGLLGWMLHLNWIYWVGWFAVAVILHFEHELVKGGDLSKLNAAFFNMNGYMSVVYFLFTATAVVAMRAV